MRRRHAVVACIVIVLGMLAPPALAQAPAPKVTITGLVDQVTSLGRNFYDGNYARTSDREWYARTRFRPDFTFEVGRTKAVLGLEIDLQYGQGAATDGGFPGNVTGASGHRVSSNGGLDLNTDVGGVIEVKWIYTEFDLTGKDSLLPFIPVATVARAGGQPFASLATYKAGAYATGDFAGVSAVTTWAPNVKTNLAFVMVEDELAGGNRGGALARTTRGDDFAVVFSPEVLPLKGLDVKPLYSFFHAEGLTSGSARRGATNRLTVGGNVNVAAAVGGGNPNGATDHHENRHTIGFDARWRSGPFWFDPMVLYQFGTRDNQCACPTAGGGFVTRKVEADASAWLIDLQGGLGLGPLLLEARAIYSTGNKARDNLSRSVRYFEVLDADTSYYTGWAHIVSKSVIEDYNVGAQNGGLVTNIGYDRYGRVQLGVKVTYSFTPQLSLAGIVNPTWTAETVDTDTGTTGFTRTIVSDRSFVKGDSRYIGTDADLWLTWRFAPNTTFDLVGAYLFAGGALDTTELLNGVPQQREAQDAHLVAARVRFSF